MYLDFLVPIPDVKGKITTKQKGDSIYVNYEVGRQYDSGKKYNVPKRSMIGKLSKVDSKNDGSESKLPDLLPGGGTAGG